MSEDSKRTEYDDALLDDSLSPDERLDAVADEHEEVTRVKAPEPDTSGDSPNNPDSGSSPTRVVGGSTGATGGGTGGNG